MNPDMLTHFDLPTRPCHGEKPVASQLSATEEKLLAIVKNLRGIRFFWDCGRLLHPRTPAFLGAAVSDLESLKDAESGG